MKNKLILSLIAINLLVVSYNANSQTFNSAGSTAIATNGINYYNDISVSGIGSITAGSAELATVTINITHTWDSDLAIYLIAPDATEIDLSSGNGGSGDNYIVTTFDDAAATAITAGTAPFNGTYRPEQTISTMNNGQNADGTWRLRVIDNASGDIGTINSWSLTFTPPPSPMAYNSSTTTQNNTTDVAQGSTNQEIIGIEVNTTGGSSPLDLTQLLINIGTTNIADITGNINIYYTGLSSTFATTTFFGSVAANTGSLTVNGNQTLSSGTNYFWVTFDIDAVATIGNTVDAQCTQITVDGSNYTPTVTSPTGSRTITDVPPACGASTISLTYSESYESGLGDWSQSTSDDFDWSQNSGSTPSSTTGPSSAQDGSNYYYIETSGPSTGATAILESNCFNFSTCSAPQITFWYHMYGSTMGTLDLEVESSPGSGIWTNIWSLSGDQGNNWFQATVDLSAYSNSYVKMRFIGTRGTNYYSDIAIDNIEVTCQSPMSYISSTVVQSSTNTTYQGATNQQIIQVEVTTSGSISPIDLTQLVLNMNGTTDINDVSNIDVYFTGTSSSFATTTLFGTAGSAGGSINVNGTATLSEGINYFWIVYDIDAAATYNNFVDAECTEITVDGSSESPSTTAPAGDREIIEITTCEHTIKLYDTNANGWGTYWNGSSTVNRTVDVYVDGSPVLTGLNLPSGQNGVEYTFSADDGSVITTVVNGGSSEMKYVILGANGTFIADDGNDQNTPTGVSGTGVCVFNPQFIVNQDAYHNTIGSTDCFTLTSDAINLGGTIYNKYKVDLSQDFEIESSMHFGAHDDLSGVFYAADGIVFVLQDSCTEVGGTGQGIGFEGITPSIGIEFDTYYNAGNNDYAPSGEWDHTSMFRNGSVVHGGADELTATVGLAQSSFGVSGITDGATHDVRVTWNAGTQTLNMYWDGAGAPTLTYSDDIVTNIFGGKNQVFWGFTSATGARFNRHRVCVTKYPNSIATTQLQDDTIQSGQSVQNAVQTGALEYTWTPNDGTIDDASIYNPTMSPDTTTIYDVMIVGNCDDTIYDQVKVFVEQNLSLQKLNLSVNCFSGKKQLVWNGLNNQNSINYKVLASLDGIDFNTISSTKNNEFEIADQYYNYFKIEAKSKNGKITKSNIVQSECKDEFAIKAAHLGENQFLINSNSNQNVEILLYDYLGREIEKSTYTLNQGANYFSINNIISKGIYILKVNTTKGQENLKFKY